MLMVRVNTFAKVKPLTPWLDILAKSQTPTTAIQSGAKKIFQRKINNMTPLEWFRSKRDMYATEKDGLNERISLLPFGDERRKLVGRLRMVDRLLVDVNYTIRLWDELEI